MRILLDADGVLCDLLPPWLAQYNAITGESVGVEAIRAYNFSEQVAHPAAMRTALSLVDYTDVAPMPGAVEGYRRLVAAGHAVRIVTYTPQEARHHMLQKLDWFYAHLDAYFDPRSVTFCHSSEKQFFDGDVLVEDYPQTLREWVSHGLYRRTGYLVSHEYNTSESLTGVPVVRVGSLSEVADRLCPRTYHHAAAGA